MSLDGSQPGKVLPSKVLMLNMCSFPAQLLINARRKSICSTRGTHGDMLFPNAAIEILFPPPSSIWMPDAFAFCNCSQPQLFVYSSETRKKKKQVCRYQWAWIFSGVSVSFSWHREGFRPRCLRESNWGFDLRHQQEQQFGHGGCQDAEGWGSLPTCTAYECCWKTCWDAADAQIWISFYVWTVNNRKCFQHDVHSVGVCVRWSHSQRA